MQSKLEQKTKTELNGLEEKFQFYQMDKKRTIILFISYINNNQDIVNTKKIIKEILNFSNDNLFSSIAINIDFSEYKSYLQFKIRFRYYDILLSQ